MRKVEFSAGCHYHLHSRGVNGQQIFFNEGNWGCFLRLVRRYGGWTDLESDVSPTEETVGFFKKPSV